MPLLTVADLDAYTGMFLLRTACSIRAQSELGQEHELLESLLQVAKILFKNNNDLMGTLDQVMEHVSTRIITLTRFRNETPLITSTLFSEPLVPRYQNNTFRVG